MIGLSIAGAIWLLTFVVPVTFMILMSWSCESSSRQIGSLAIAYYGEPELEPSGTRLQRVCVALRPDPGRGGRRFVRWLLLIVSVGVPLVLLALSVSHTFKSVTWLHGVGALVGLALVTAFGVTRRN